MNLTSLKTSASGASGTLGRSAKTLATAAVALAATAPLMTAQASIVYQANMIQHVTAGGPGDAFILAGHSPTTFAATTVSKGFAYLNLGSLSDIFIAYNGSSTSSLAVGTLVGISTNFSSASNVLFEYSVPGTGSAYMGFSTHLPGVFNPVYGWLKFSFDAQNNVQLNSYAYQNNGQAIAVGDTGVVVTVPEPSALLLAATSLGLLGWMRRRGGSVKT